MLIKTAFAAECIHPHCHRLYFEVSNTAADMILCAAPQAETFEVVKANLYQSLGQLATVMDDQHLDFLFQRFESARSRPLPDTLRLFGLLQQLVLSDSRVSCRGLAAGTLPETPAQPVLRAARAFCRLTSVS